MILTIGYICFVIILATFFTMMFCDLKSPFQISTIIGWLYYLSYLILLFVVVYLNFFLN